MSACAFASSPRLPNLVIELANWLIAKTVLRLPEHHNATRYAATAAAASPLVARRCNLPWLAFASAGLVGSVVCHLAKCVHGIVHDCTIPHRVWIPRPRDGVYDVGSIAHASIGYIHNGRRH